MRERITISLGSLGGAVSAHATSIAMATHSSTDTATSTPYFLDASFRTATNKPTSSFSTMATPQSRGVLICEKADFIGFNDCQVDEPTPEPSAISAAWAGSVDVFGTAADGSYGDFRSAINDSFSRRNFMSSGQREQEQVREEQGKVIPGGRTVDWDAYLAPEYGNDSNYNSSSAMPPAPPSNVAATLQQCGGTSNILGWRDFYPSSLPILHQLPLWSLRQSSAESYGSSDTLGAEFINDVYDDIRVLLEECDSVDGFQYLTTYDPTMAYFAGLNTLIVNELRSECKSACQMTNLIVGRVKSESELREEAGDHNLDSRGRTLRSNFRGALNAGLTLHGLNSAVDVVATVDLKCCEDLLRADVKPSVGGYSFLSPVAHSNLFNATGVAALALDSVATPFMLKERHDCGGVAVAGSGIASGTEMYADRMGINDLCGVMKPRGDYKWCEVSAGFVTEREVNLVTTPPAESSDGRMRRDGPAAAHTSLLDRLTALTTGVTGLTDATVFATSVAGRFGGVNTVELRRQVLQNVFQAVQPVRMAATVVNMKDEIGGLNLGGYWGTVLGGRCDESTAMVSCLSNSTSSHKWINEVSSRFGKALGGTLVDGGRGFLTSEIARGGFMEIEDAKEVLEEMRCIGDLYEKESFY